MRTTVEIPDDLLRKAERVAAERGTTFKVVLEDALRAALEASGERRAVRIRTHTFRGEGLQPGIAWGDWTKQATASESLLEHVQRRKQARILELFGTVDYDAALDRKRKRRRA